MCNFKTGKDEQPQRPVHLEAKLENLLGKTIIGHDTALYWRIMKNLNISPITKQGKLLESLK